MTPNMLAIDYLLKTFQNDIPLKTNISNSRKTTMNEDVSPL